MIENNLINNILEANKETIISTCYYGKNKVLFILKNEQNISFFKQNQKLVKKCYAKKILPLFITENHFLTSQDVFPLEFLEIKYTLQNIYGENISDKININKENLRLEIEQQIKGLLIRIYQILLEVKINSKNVKNIINTSNEKFIICIQGFFFLKTNEYIKKDKLEFQEIEIDLNKISHDKYDENSLEEYIFQMQKFAKIIDELKI